MSDPPLRHSWFLRIARGVVRRWPWLHRRARRWRAGRSVRRERLLCADFAGAQIYYPSTSSIGQAIAAGKGWEPTLAEALDILLPRNQPLLIAEVGSNIGATLAQMISVRPNARYVCFEPARRFRTLLARTVRENGWENVVIEDSCVGSANGAVNLFTSTSTASAVRQEYGHVFLGVEHPRCIRLDEYFAAAARLDVIKTDTDGFDADVLLGARNVLARLRPAIYFELAPFLLADADRNATDLLEYLVQLGYRHYVLYTQGGELLKLSTDVPEVVELAERHGYVDVLTAAHAEQVSQLPGVARSAILGNRALRGQNTREA
jgi:FkbM family methyltransferase